MQATRTALSGPTLRPLAHADYAWRVACAGGRLDAIERCAPAMRGAIEESGVIRAVRTLDVARFPYPMQHAFGGACSISIAYVWMFNRALIVEYKDWDGE